MKTRFLNSIRHPVFALFLMGLMALAVWRVFGQGEGVANRLPAERGKLSVLDFGAIGNGIADDTQAIQKAVNSKAATLDFPAGTYRLTKTITINLDEVGFTSLTADGTAQIVMAGAGPAFRFVGTHGGTADPESAQANVWQKQRMPQVTGLAISGEHAEADGIEAAGTMQLTVTGVHLRALRHGIHLVERNRNVLITGCHIYHNRGCGIYLDHVNLHQTNIVGSHISYNGGGGVVVRGGEVRNVHITGCDIEANQAADGPPTANVLFDSTDGSMAEAAIVGCTIQHSRPAPQSANIRILGKGIFPHKGKPQEFHCGHVTIGDNVLSDVQTNIHLSGARGVTIVGNTFWQGYEHNLLVEDSHQIVIGANMMERNPLYGYTDEAKNRVHFHKCSDCTIQGLHLHQVQQSPAGITLEECRRMHLTGCSILDCDNIGVRLVNVTQSRIADNLIRDDRGNKPASIPLQIQGGYGNVILNNLFLGKPDIDPASGSVRDNDEGHADVPGNK